MPLLADFHAELLDDRVVIPNDALAVLRRFGGGRFRVMIEPAMGGADELERRGISTEIVGNVAEAQKLERDLAAVVLSGEGIACASALDGRLRSLIAPPAGSNEADS